MELKSVASAATEEADKIKDKTDYLWHDPLTELDDTSTISACENILKMYEEEQAVTQLIINDIMQEQKNIKSIAKEFSSVDKFISGFLKKL